MNNKKKKIKKFIINPLIKINKLIIIYYKLNLN